MTQKWKVSTVDYNKGLCDYMHIHNDQEHATMREQIKAVGNKADEVRVSVNGRIDKMQLLLISNLIGIGLTLAVIVIKVT